ncbi:PIN domain nuclease, a component of toxin-antitoxin system (PIN domain) [Sphingomonas sp. YR710]|uniref:type II toxin-antitoxin system VapC family toxin n=1 Tax=Sphingomonas sp. YR710 TaxID=1882773 RepID=UPI000888BE67|nr:type II toxin-antitoxin system VapC family toxin [Sphingomonas sp. YR710]SDC95350.1 PIN domain nuclease, a component of toxin-antitoxin system (PIN domain) [Sphingomonas sp. YR710]
MKLLLDTHALIWAVQDNPRLGRRARARIGDRKNKVLFSTVSIWEILIKIRTGKLHIDWRKLTGAAGEAGYARLDIGIDHMEALDALPLRHGDPYDHLILAQAISERATLVTADQNMKLYDVPILECG